jgi:hypothetical protein
MRASVIRQRCHIDKTNATQARSDTQAKSFNRELTRIIPAHVDES